MEFYQKSKNEVMRELKTRPEGLSEEEAALSREKYGANVLKEEGRKSVLRIFLEQYKDFLVIILIIAAVISGILGDMESAVVILVVITINSVLGTVQNVKAEQSIAGLKKLSAPEAKVMREGSVVSIKTEELAMGDILVLEAGDYICADARIIENAGLKTDESALTGESEPAEKADIDINGETAPGDRKNMVYSGCFVTYGRGRAVVTGIGMNTEIGKIASLLKSTGENRTPLQISLDNFGKKLSIIILIICAVVFGLSMIRGEAPVNAFVFAVALAVAAIPEALSSIVTIVLSVGTQKLAKENAVIRKLQAVEGLGSVSVICTDKTGTLTCNKMTVKALFSDNGVTGGDNKAAECEERLMAAGVLCNDASNGNGTEIGDPTEIAVVSYCAKHGLNVRSLREKYPRLGELPFDSDRKLMSTVHEIDGELTMVTKGAADVLLPRIREIRTNEGKRAFTEQDAQRVKKANSDFSENGLRVLAVCEKAVSHADIAFDEENEYVFLGLIAMQDPPRPESKAAVEKCKAALIRPVMITGDHLVTASAIAKDIGILEDGYKAIEGRELDGLNDEELDKLVENVSVYARVSPEHKLRIVKSWQRIGNITAMTGDGVNDAPALKQADVGVAMGMTGNEVAKDAASVVLTDDNFATIVKAVENGRNLYANIRKSVQFLLSGNAAAIFAVIYASVLGLSVPFKAVHLLFINLLTDSLPAIALGSEPHTPEVMKDKPRDKNESILTGRVLKSIGTEGVVIAVFTMLAFYIGLSDGADKASTMAFSVLCLSRLWHGFNCKSASPVWFTKRFADNKALIAAFIIGFVLLNAVLLIPGLHGVFAAAALSGAELGAVYGLSFGTFAVIQILKMIRR